MPPFSAGSATVPGAPHGETLTIFVGAAFNRFNHAGVAGSVVFPELALEMTLQCGPLLAIEDEDIRFDIELFTEAIFHFGGVLIRRAFGEALGVGLTCTHCVGHHAGEKRAYQGPLPFEDGLFIFLWGEAFARGVFGFHGVNTDLLAVIFHEEIEMGEAQPGPLLGGGEFEFVGTRADGARGSVGHGREAAEEEDLGAPFLVFFRRGEEDDDRGVRVHWCWRRGCFHWH